MSGRRTVIRARKRVALLIETSNSYARGILEGVVDYMREHEPWSVYLPEQRRGEPMPPTLARWRGDGVIARIEHKDVAAWLARARIPAVDVSAGRLLPAVPWVETNDEAIADAAYQHLAERGFRSFAYLGDARFNWSRWRRDAFARLCEAAGHPVQVFELTADARTGSSKQREEIAEWVKHLPRATGVLACYDIAAQQLLDACRELDTAVPEEIAVVGVDNDELLCRLSDPPLSSVAPDTRRTGYEAAALLDRLMQGEAIEPIAHLIPPVGVVTRQSTDVLAINDRHVADALRLIREHAWDGITVGDVIARSSLSRRVLESRFRKILGRTPHEELVRARLARVKVLLAESELTIAEIAERTGYTHIEYLSAQFRREVGMPPSRYRETFRAGSPKRRA